MILWYTMDWFDWEAKVIRIKNIHRIGQQSGTRLGYVYVGHGRTVCIFHKQSNKLRQTTCTSHILSCSISTMGTCESYWIIEHPEDWELFRMTWIGPRTQCCRSCRLAAPVGGDLVGKAKKCQSTSRPKGKSRWRSFGRKQRSTCDHPGIICTYRLNNNKHIVCGHGNAISSAWGTWMDDISNQLLVQTGIAPTFFQSH